MARTLVAIRHAKSDWHVAADDRHRPVAERGRRQAPVTGRWLRGQGIRPDLAVVSAAERARQTWELVSAELGGEVSAQSSEAAYTFSGDDLVDLVRSAPQVGILAVVGHNPAMEELVHALTGEWVRMTTASVAVIDLPDWSATGTLRYCGRPADSA
ncbi:MAG: histidine phosphatase family protein [Dermatophilaceae bacterium]